MRKYINQEGESESNVGKQIQTVQDHKEEKSKSTTLQKAQCADNPLRRKKGYSGRKTPPQNDNDRLSMRISEVIFIG